MPDKDLDALRKYSRQREAEAATWGKAAEVLETVISYEGIDATAKARKVELSVNVAELTKVKEEVANINKVLAGKRTKVSKMNKFLEGGYKVAEAEMYKELAAKKEAQMTSDTKELNAGRKKIKQVSDMLAEYQADLRDVKAELVGIRDKISEELPVKK